MYSCFKWDCRVRALQWRLLGKLVFIKGITLYLSPIALSFCLSCTAVFIRGKPRLLLSLWESSSCYGVEKRKYQFEGGGR